MKRSLSVCSGVLALMAVAPPVHSEGRPGREPAPAGDASYAAGQACAFPVSLHVVGNREYYHASKPDADGSQRFQVTGNLSYDITNDLTGTTVHHDASGPAKGVSRPDGSVHLDASGNWLLINYPDDVVTINGVRRVYPSFVLVSGSGTMDFPPNSPAVIVYHGDVVDVCSELA